MFRVPERLREEDMGISQSGIARTPCNFTQKTWFWYMLISLSAAGTHVEFQLNRVFIPHAMGLVCSWHFLLKWKKLDTVQMEYQIKGKVPRIFRWSGESWHVECLGLNSLSRREKEKKRNWNRKHTYILSRRLIHITKRTSQKDQIFAMTHTFAFSWLIHAFLGKQPMWAHKQNKWETKIGHALYGAKIQDGVESECAGAVQATFAWRSEVYKL